MKSPEMCVCVIDKFSVYEDRNDLERTTNFVFVTQMLDRSFRREKKNNLGFVALPRFKTQKILHKQIKFVSSQLN